MAATVSSVWAKPGAWALDSEENEDELNRQIDLPYHPPAPEPPASEFPSLSAAAAKPKKKNKGQTLSLGAFANYSNPKPATFQVKRVTQEEVISLPTGPRERTAEELDRTRLGGGFRSYGGGDSSRVRVSDRNREGYEGNSTRDRDMMGPSRADEVDDWSKGKKVGSFGGGSGADRRDKGGFFNSSRADDVDNWGSNKSFIPQSEGPRRDRRMGFESYSNGSGPESDNWGRKKEERPADPEIWGRRREEERGMDSENWGRKKEEERESSNANGVGRPRLNLQPRTITPVNNEQGVTPTEGGKPKGSNPFGEARPREEVLAEKGKDWKEIDEKLEAVKIKEGEKGEGLGWRKGFVAARVDSGDEKTIKTWRKPESNDAVSLPPLSEEKNESYAQVTEKSATIDKDVQEN